MHDTTVYDSNSDYLNLFFIYRPLMDFNFAFCSANPPVIRENPTITVGVP